eukprot:sb/3472924/
MRVRYWACNLNQLLTCTIPRSGSNLRNLGREIRFRIQYDGGGARPKKARSIPDFRAGLAFFGLFWPYFFVGNEITPPRERPHRVLLGQIKSPFLDIESALNLDKESVSTRQEPTNTSEQPIRTHDLICSGDSIHYLGIVTGYQPIRGQYIILIRLVPAN